MPVIARDWQRKLSGDLTRSYVIGRSCRLIYDRERDARELRFRTRRWVLTVRRTDADPTVIERTP